MTPNLKKLIEDNQWRPIEEAPRDRSTFLVNCNGVECGQTLALWEKRALCGAFDGMPFMGWNPTPFRPLPDDRAAKIIEVLWLALMEVKAAADYRGHDEEYSIVERVERDIEQIAGGEDDKR